MSESDSHENLHPRLSGSRFFICIKPARVERKCVPHFDFFHWEKICSEYSFFHIHLLISKGWGLLQCWYGSRSIPPCALFQETLECVGPEHFNLVSFPRIIKNAANVQKWWVTCTIGNSLRWPKNRRNPPFFVKTVPSLILKQQNFQSVHNRRFLS